MASETVQCPGVEIYNNQTRLIPTDSLVEATVTSQPFGQTEIQCMAYLNGDCGRGDSLPFDFNRSRVRPSCIFSYMGKAQNPQLEQMIRSKSSQPLLIPEQEQREEPAPEPVAINKPVPAEIQEPAILQIETNRIFRPFVGKTKFEAVDLTAAYDDTEKPLPILLCTEFEYQGITGFIELVPDYPPDFSDDEENDDEDEWNDDEGEEEEEDEDPELGENEDEYYGFADKPFGKVRWTKESEDVPDPQNNNELTYQTTVVEVPLKFRLRMRIRNVTQYGLLQNRELEINTKLGNFYLSCSGDGNEHIIDAFRKAGNGQTIDVVDDVITDEDGDIHRVVLPMDLSQFEDVEMRIIESFES